MTKEQVAAKLRDEANRLREMGQPFEAAKLDWAAQDLEPRCDMTISVGDSVEVNGDGGWVLKVEDGRCSVMMWSGDIVEANVADVAKPPTPELNAGDKVTLVHTGGVFTVTRAGGQYVWVENDEGERHGVPVCQVTVVGR